MSQASTTTYQYVSLLEVSFHPELEEGKQMLYPGKKPEVYMPNEIVDDEVVGVRYERLGHWKLPRHMNADEAFAWARTEKPGELAEFYEGTQYDSFDADGGDDAD